MTASLEYQQRPRWYRRNLRHGLLAILLLSASVCAAVWLVRFTQQIARVHAQQQWMHFTLPPDTIVLSARHADERQLITNLGYHRMANMPFDEKDAVPLVIHAPPTGLIWGGSEACVFLHQLRVKNGPWRLVSVPLHRGPPFNPIGRETCEFEAFVQAPATLQIGSRLRPVAAYSFVQPQVSLLTTRPLRVYAGQPDPADDSHFTIRYQIEDSIDFIDGWLMPDDTVKLETRNNVVR